jgi:hypothetical protein
MDYFSELLESYNKLKKRTFKLTYISEAEDEAANAGAEPGGAAESALLKILGNAAEGEGKPITDPSYPGLETFIFWKGPTGGIVVSKGRGQVYVLTPEGEWETGESAVKMKEALLNAMGGGEEGKKPPGQLADDLAKQQADLAEEARVKRLSTVGSLLDLDPDRFEDPERLALAAAIKKAEQDCIDQMTKLCELDKDPPLLSPNICATDQSKLRYIGGSNKTSLEYKLVNGTGQVITVDGKLERTQISSEQIKAVFDTNLQLLEQMGKNPPNCAFVGKRFGKVGKLRVVIFTNPDRPDDDPAQGIVFPNTGMLASMLNTLDKGCQEEEGGIEDHKFSSGSAARNEIKGRFNELFMSVITRVYSKARGWQGQNLNDEEKREVLKEVLGGLIEKIKEQRKELIELAGNTPLSEQGVDLESYPLMVEVNELLQSTENSEGLKNLLEQMLVQMGTLLKQVEADDMIPAGTSQRLGGKVDNFLLYVGNDAVGRANSKAHYLGLHDVTGEVIAREMTPKQLYESASAKAEDIKAALERQGLKIDDDVTKIAVLSIGNKMSVGGTVKFGDLSFLRALNIAMNLEISGSSQPADEDLYYEKLHRSLGLDPASVDSAATYMEPLRETAIKCKLLSQEANYNDRDGNIKVTIPDDDATTAADRALGAFTYDARSSFYRTCTVEKSNDAPPPALIRVQADWTDPKVQKDMTESLQRDFLTKQFTDDLEGKDPIARQGATDSLCLIAGATIMEMSEMSQIVTQEKGSENPDYNPDLPKGPDNIEYFDDQEALMLNQNDILRAIGKARQNPDWRPTISGSTISFPLTVKGKKIEYKINMERQKHRAAFAGKMSKEDVDSAGRTVERLQPRDDAWEGKPENSSTFMQYLSGQMRLLETLISQSK